MIGYAVTKVHEPRSLSMKVDQLRKENHQDSIIETSIVIFFTSKIAGDITSVEVKV